MQSTRQSMIELSQADIPRLYWGTGSPMIEDVQWKIEAGDFWAVGAMPGSGKTGLLYTAAGLQRPIKGKQLMFGKDVREMSEEELVEKRLKIGMVFDSGRLFAEMTVAENLALPLAYHFHLASEKRTEAINKVLAAIGLSDLANEKPSQITRNLHQRAGLARALVLNPDVLLIDNPLLSVDPRQARWWLDFLCQLNKGTTKLRSEPITIAVATDDLRPWRDTAQQFAFIQEKKLRIVGGRENLRQNADPAVRELLTPGFEGGYP